ncbi:hypothetical protein MIND_00398000 [Mycena indigotica]|uniref:Uncharacterized protein n=1 Tax=Mycena indigotica TaxID=2126181 RepID=A0A8H6T226_9AGAR|nr:uncharacterized protein MIND_00398000 [Mycena indigotica]KAF7310243.1 hypothetical protein MIND_00398000 [Mycena indigotica]
MFPNELYCEILKGVPRIDLGSIARFHLLVRPFLYRRLHLRPSALSRTCTRKFGLPTIANAKYFIEKLRFYASPDICQFVHVLHIIGDHEDTTLEKLDWTMMMECRLHETPFCAGRMAHVLRDRLFDLLGNFVHLRSLIAERLLFTAPALLQLTRLEGPLTLNLIRCCFPTLPLPFDPFIFPMVLRSPIRICVSTLTISSPANGRDFWLWLSLLNPDTLKQVTWVLGTQPEQWPSTIPAVLPRVKTLVLDLPWQLSRPSWAVLRHVFPSVTALTATGVASGPELTPQTVLAMITPSGWHLNIHARGFRALRAVQTGCGSLTDAISGTSIVTLRIDECEMHAMLWALHYVEGPVPRSITTLAVHIRDGSGPGWAAVLTFFPALDNLEFLVSMTFTGESMEATQWLEMRDFLMTFPSILPTGLTTLTFEYRSISAALVAGTTDQSLIESASASELEPTPSSRLPPPFTQHMG